jgi:ABC-2 type transport system permease protein
MNPMIRKELRQRMRERRAWLLPSLYLLALAGAVALAYYFQTEETFGQGTPQPQGAQIGVTVFFTVTFTQMALLLLMAPVFSAGSITIEKEQRTLGGLLTSLLTPAQIWWGKFVAALLFLVLLLVSALPVLSLSFSLGGVGLGDVARAAGITLLVLASMSALGLYCSSFFRRSVHSTAVSYAIVIALTVITFVAFLILESRWLDWHPGSQGTAELPRHIVAALYLNPFFPLTALIPHQHEHRFPDWAISLILFAAMGCLAAVLAVRNLKHAGEQF